MQAFVAAAVLAAVLAGCAAPPAQPPVAAKPQVQFLDVPGFDQELAASMNAPLPRVEVGFYDRVPPSKMPERLQKWMAALESNGGKVKVTPPPSTVAARSPLMLISALTTMWSAHKALREAEAEARMKAAGGYDAELVLKNDGGDVLIDRIVFQRRAP